MTGYLFKSRIANAMFYRSCNGNTIHTKFCPFASVSHGTLLTNSDIKEYVNVRGWLEWCTLCGPDGARVSE